MKQFIRAIMFTSITLLIIGFVIAANTAPAPDDTIPQTVAAQPTQDPVLVADAQRLGIDYKAISWHYSSDEITASLNSIAETTNDTVIGLFEPPDTIIIATNLSTSDELNIVAYEYMHYVWAGLTDTQRQDMGALLDQYRTRNPSFDTDVSRYHGDAATIQNEENSTACTRVDPSLLSDSFNNYCNQYIPNRALLFR